MTATIDARDLTVRFGDTTALDGLDLSLPTGRIYGLLGRNGSGKTTLLSLLAGFRRPTAGSLTVHGHDPFEHAGLMASTIMVGGGLGATVGGSSDSSRVRDKLWFAARLRPRWDAELADELLRRFDLAPRTRVNALSTGQAAALGVTIGLASRAPVTLFDEAHLGMDAPSRYAFYDALLEDYAAHPRTIVLSTHHIDEVARLFEAVVILDRGRVLAQEDTDVLRARGTTVTGPADAVDRVLDGHAVLREQRLGRTKSVVVYGEGAASVRDRARAAGLDLGPVPLQDLVVHLTADRSPEVVR